MFVRTGKSDRFVGPNDRCVESTFHSSGFTLHKKDSPLKLESKNPQKNPLKFNVSKDI